MIDIDRYVENERRWKEIEPKEYKRNLEYFNSYYGRYIVPLHEQILEELRRCNVSKEAIEEIEYLMQYEEFKMIDESIIAPSEMFLKACAS